MQTERRMLAGAQAAALAWLLAYVFLTFGTGRWVTPKDGWTRIPSGTLARCPARQETGIMQTENTLQQTSHADSALLVSSIHTFLRKLPNA